MKKICYITTTSGSLEQFVLPSVIYNHSLEDWEVTFICDSDCEFNKILPDYIRYIPVKIKRGFSLSGIKSTIDLYKIFKKEKFDLVQYSTTNAACYASIAAKLTHIPVRLYCEWGLGFLYDKGFRRLILEIIERIICFNSTNVQPDSKENLEIAISNKLYDRTKGAVIGNGSTRGVDFEKINVCYKDTWRNEIREKYNITNSFVFGFVGRMINIKGINEFLSVSLKITDKYSDIKMMILADMSSLIKVDLELLKNAKNSDRIIFCGTTREIEKYYAAFDCFVLPSYFEGFGCATIEAEAMAVPVITSDIPGPREAMINGETGIAIIPRSSDALMNAMEIIYKNRLLAEEMGNRGLDYVKHKFNSNELLEQIRINKKTLLGQNEEE